MGSDVTVTAASALLEQIQTQVFLDLFVRLSSCLSAQYSGDPMDKQWLYENHLVPSVGTKGYILLYDQVFDLFHSTEYLCAPELNCLFLHDFYS